MSNEKSVEFEIYNLPIVQVLSGAKNLTVIFIPLKLFLYVFFVECNMTKRMKQTRKCKMTSEKWRPKEPKTCQT